ncbi:conjugal transfer protein TraK [Flagellimonas algicola]|uniref:Conjugal transfer protein TraK n=1 Tax=Flagellimonas algicola TaxID=2583815 RepID=A0ABY2WHN2_9FLAO|nr:conjugal transfer protein TraK [Allomuricauda algicola]TMU50778.1 conjugal transfer protein TraK [Allomuricauda algicola]
MNKIPYKNIYDTLKLNRFIVLSLVVATALTCTVSVLMVIKLHKETLDKVFVVKNNGDIIPLQLVEQRENLGVEALAHLERFHGWFYGIDANSYKRNIEKALWLGNTSVDGLYRQKKADGFYNRLLQYSLIQKVLKIESKLGLDKEPYGFETTTIFEINRGTVTDTYELVTTGKLIHVDRNFPNNPHGLLITDYFENSLRKLVTYEEE